MIILDWLLFWCLDWFGFYLFFLSYFLDLGSLFLSSVSFSQLFRDWDIIDFELGNFLELTDDLDYCDELRKLNTNSTHQCNQSFEDGDSINLGQRLVLSDFLDFIVNCTHSLEESVKFVIFFDLFLVIIPLKQIFLSAIASSGHLINIFVVFIDIYTVIENFYIFCFKKGGLQVRLDSSICLFSNVR